MVKLVNTKKEKDWRVVEYVMPITEAVGSGKDFIIRGTAINETTTRNGITYNAAELQSAAPTFRNKPIMVDHSGSVKDIVGRTTENVQFSEMNRSIEFEGRIMDPKIKEMINDGRITDVSIGAKVTDLIEDKKAGTITAVGMEGLEISLVAIPGDPGANLANALSESFRLKEMDMTGETIDLSEEEADKFDTELNNVKEDNMEEAEKKEVVQSVDEQSVEEVKAEEKTSVTNVNVDLSAVTESIKMLSEQVAALTKKVSENEETPAPSEESEEDEIPAEVEDETKGEVGSDEEESEVAEEGFVVEAAETGRGQSLYRDYSKLSGKFNRLCR